MRSDNDNSDKLDEVLAVLRQQGAEIGAIAFCNGLFGHNRIDKLTFEERDQLTILLRKKILEASMETGTRIKHIEGPDLLQ